MRIINSYYDNTVIIIHIIICIRVKIHIKICFSEKNIPKYFKLFYKNMIKYVIQIIFFNINIL